MNWAHTDCIRRVFRLLVGLSLCLACSADAHKPSDSYLSLDCEGAQIRGRWDIALRDLDYAIGLDMDRDGSIRWGEVGPRQQEIAAYALARVGIVGGSGGAAGTNQFLNLAIDHHTDGAYAVIQFAVLGLSAVKALEIEYRLFFDLDPQHRGLFRLVRGSVAQSAVFSPESPSRHFELGGTSAWRSLWEFTREGVWHIWIGFDHILFLLTLLIPAVLVRSEQGWQGERDFRKSATNIVKIVTAFTLAHSITLALASARILVLPSRLVESAIAASVVLASLNNLLPFYRGHAWTVAFAFGLIHGCGFAAVLAELGLARESFAVALFGFNAGVEIGQLAIVAVFLPLAFVFRDSWAYRTLTLKAGSIVVAGIASLWFVERAFDFELASWLGRHY